MANQFWLAVFICLLSCVLCKKKFNVNPKKKPSSNPFSAFARILKDSKRDLVAAAVARSVSIFALYPVDTIKVSLEVFLLAILIRILRHACK